VQKVHPLPFADGERPPLELDGADPLTTQLFGALMRTFRLHGQLLHRIASSEGGHPGQAMCLRILAAHDGVSQRDLAATMQRSAPTVSAMLRRMERGGVIRRCPDELDQRVTRVFLTEDGRRHEREFRAALAAHLVRVLEAIPEDDRREAARLLGAIADSTARVLA
jgi:DNA-binding MarR family transcriptional regulator